MQDMDYHNMLLSIEMAKYLFKLNGYRQGFLLTGLIWSQIISIGEGTEKRNLISIQEG